MDQIDILLSKLYRLRATVQQRSEEHTSELQSHSDLVCRLLLEKKKTQTRKPLRRERQKRDRRVAEERMSKELQSLDEIERHAEREWIAAVDKGQKRRGGGHRH